MIESAQNATFKKLLSLTAAKGLKKEGLFLLSGEALLHEYLKKPQLDLHYEIIAPKAQPLTQDAAKHIQFTKPLFDEIDVLGTGFNLLVLAQPKIEKLDQETLKVYRPRGIELVIPTGDPGNCGALIRSCEAFGAARAILTEEAAHPFLPKAVKASAGSVLRFPLARGPALAAFPESCLALSADGDDIGTFQWPAGALLAVGEEGQGLGNARFKRHLRIPTQGVESLNATVAASVALAFRAQSKR